MFNEIADGGEAAGFRGQGGFGVDVRDRDRRASGAVPDRHQRTVADHHPLRMFRQGDFKPVRLAVADGRRRFRYDTRPGGMG